MKDKIYICHISDLHFGIFENKAYSQVDPTFTLPYSFIEFISGLPENKKPHFLIISGDLTSISEEEEYEQFLQFIEDFIGDRCFSNCNKYSEKDRIIIIPGNHDTVRKLKSGKEFGNDKLESFKNKIVSEGFNTPFGNNNEICFTEKEEKGSKKRHPCPIPCAFYYYPEYNIVFSALISCYFSHKINPELLDIYNDINNMKITSSFIKKLEEYIKKNIYEDYGSFPYNYQRVINRAFNNFKSEKSFTIDKYKNLIKLAVSHHHLVNLDHPQVNTMNGPQTLELLYRHGVISVLHGHIHDILKERYVPRRWHGISSCISSGTLSGYCRNTLNKFNMIEINNFMDIQKMTLKILCYDVDSDGVFSSERELYSSKIKNFFNSMKASLENS